MPWTPPSTVLVDSFTWRVHCSFRRPKWVTDKGCVGWTDFGERRIWISGRLSDEERALALAHELLHTLLPDGTFNDALEEAIVTLSEKRLYSLLRDNDLSFFRRGV